MEDTVATTAAVLPVVRTAPRVAAVVTAPVAAADIRAVVAEAIANPEKLKQSEVNVRGGKGVSNTRPFSFWFLPENKSSTARVGTGWLGAVSLYFRGYPPSPQSLESSC